MSFNDSRSVESSVHAVQRFAVPVNAAFAEFVQRYEAAVPALDLPTFAQTRGTARASGSAGTSRVVMANPRSRFAGPQSVRGSR